MIWNMSNASPLYTISGSFAFTFLVLTGMRTSEACGTSWTEIDRA